MSDTEIRAEHNTDPRKIKSPEEKAAEAAKKRNRYNSDPEYRQKYLDKLKARAAKKGIIKNVGF